MRVTGGKFRGRSLVGPSHEGLRPTSDRVREAVFNILLAGAPGVALDGARVIDLFAGTGALGMEALSRGAAFCLFVEDSAAARGLIRRNIEAMGLEGVTKVFRRDATRLGAAAGRFDLAFLDPPYGCGLAERALASLIAGGWLNAGAVAVIEEAADVDVAVPSEFTALDRRLYGDTAVLFARFNPEHHAAPV